MEPQRIELRSKGVRPEVERLEARVAPSHLGHEVVLPAAAAHGLHGLQTAGAAPASHRRAMFIDLEGDL